MGYTLNENPIPSKLSMLAVGAPLYYQHQLSVGTSYRIAENVRVHVAYTHYFNSDTSGPLLTAAGPVPGSSVTTRLRVHVASVGATVKY